MRRPQVGQTHSSAPDSPLPVRIISCLAGTVLSFLLSGALPGAPAPRVRQSAVEPPGDPLLLVYIPANRGSVYISAGQSAYSPGRRVTGRHGGWHSPGLIHSA